ncbi:MAG: GSCFA domain-containing protein [Sphingobacteriales bacterium]|nr:MAG: GSCFA domain-containing protein [Sphingobacteriales bacterium]
MDFQLPFTIAASGLELTHADGIVLTGSCFTEHIGKQLQAGKFPVTLNPQGIVFNPASMASGLEAIMSQKRYTEDDIFLLNGTWNSWDFHSAFSETTMDAALQAINSSMEAAYKALIEAKVLIVTFGSAYQYLLRAEYTAQNVAQGVANCHKAPGKWFDKVMLSPESLMQQWKLLVEHLKAFNPGLQIIFTVSPVRHYRDGLVENNRSKGRLLELAHSLVERFVYCHYFPAYELLIDILRDYRFYDNDMVHPNAQAVRYIWDKFCETYVSPATRQLLHRIGELNTALQHKERFPGTAASIAFRENMLAKVRQLEQEFPALDMSAEVRHFSSIEY